MRTQTTIFKISTALIISGVIFVTACKKDSNSSSGSTTNSGAQTMTTNGATSDGAYNDVFNVAVQAGSEQSIDEIMTQQKSGIQTNGVRTVNGINGYYCANITLNSNAGNFPDTLIVDFGAGCTSSGDGIARSGSITYIFSGKLSTPGTTISATFNNYTVAGYQLSGTDSLTNTTTGSSLSITNTVTNGTITYPNDSSYSFSGTKTITLASGTPPDISTFVFNVVGGYTISNTNTGETLTATITTPLEKKETCQYVDAGVVTFIYTKGSLTVDGTLNYGDGTCDNSAVITIGAATKTVTLPW
ncbi:MAG TPA: hypothetical protein VIH86_16180 [Puia sp.]